MHATILNITFYFWNTFFKRFMLDESWNKKNTSSPHTPNLITSLKKTHVVQANWPTAETGVFFLFQWKYLVVTDLFLGGYISF